MTSAALVRFGLLAESPRRMARDTLWVWPAVAIVLIWSRFGSSAGGVLFVILLVRHRPHDAFERWAPRAVSEWMLAAGAWSRKVIARTYVFELLLVSAHGALALTVVWVFSPDDDRLRAFYRDRALIEVFLISFAMLLAAQSGFALIGNIASSNRAPRWLRKSDLLKPGSAPRSVARTVVSILAIAAAIIGSAFAVRTPWGILAPAIAFTLLLARLLPEIEPVAGDGGVVERSNSGRARIARRAFAPEVGLAWEGSRASVGLLVILAAALMYVPTAYAAFGDAYVDVGVRVELQFLAAIPLLIACGIMPFRWKSSGETAAYLGTTGLPIGELRRIELLTGLALGITMIATGFALAPKRYISPEFCVAYAAPVASALLLCNRDLLRSRRLRGARARDLFLTFAVIAIGLALVVGLSLRIFGGTKWSERNTGNVLGTLLLALLAIYCATSIFLWIRAFISAGDEESLRRIELESATSA